MNVAEIARALRGRKAGLGWIACCPAHEDGNPSLSLRDIDGRVLVHCQAGCPQAAVITALKDLDLWPKPMKTAKRRQIVAEYSYTDESGKLLYQVLRTEPKGFLQRHPDGKGGWIYKKHPRQVLYRLPEVLTATVVFLVEGEKDVETLRSFGFVATTMAGGAKVYWRSSFTETLRGKTVILIPDNDEPGWALMRRVGQALLGNVQQLICFDDHHRAGAKDITEWFELGHFETQLVSLLEAAWRTK